MQTKSPLYLGKDPKSETYFFLGHKQGFGRFIKYIRYPFWAGANALVDFLDTTGEAPSEVLREVLLFVADKVEFEVVPKRRGKPETILRREVPSLTLLLEDKHVQQKQQINEVYSPLPPNSAVVPHIGSGERVRGQSDCESIPAAANSDEGRGGVLSNGRQDGPPWNVESIVHDATSNLKSKRKRRTKAEMEECRKSLLDKAV